MDKERLLEMSENPNHIKGIYNYCDRWCERCPLTSRCLLFATEKEDETADDPETHDIQNEKFWQKLHESFQLTMELIQDEAEKFGIDINNLPDDPELMQKHKDRMEAARNHPLTKKADQYFLKVHGWLENNRDLFERKSEELQNKLLMDLENENPEADAIKIKDASEVIHWYLMQIEVKLARAFNSRIKDENDEDRASYRELDDADGSAKISLIGVDRSIAAWGIMLKHFPEEENAFLDFLVILEQLRTGIEKEFPQASSFKRPGFDN